MGSIYLKNNRPKTSLRFFLEAYNYNKNDKIIINNLLLNYVNLKDIRIMNSASDAIDLDFASGDLKNIFLTYYITMNKSHD